MFVVKEWLSQDLIADRYNLTTPTNLNLIADRYNFTTPTQLNLIKKIGPLCFGLKHVAAGI